MRSCNVLWVMLKQRLQNTPLELPFVLYSTWQVRLFSVVHLSEIAVCFLVCLADHVFRSSLCTGSGKTFTMYGNAENPGIVYHCVNRISQYTKENANDFDFSMSIQVCEKEF